jgi:queuine tRNA-ribosyltransferase catalytic subunit
LLQLNKQQYSNDVHNVIDDTCGCSTCQYGNGYTRAYLSGLAGRDSSACTLITIHNLYAMKHLMNEIRQSIVDQRHDEFVLEFMQKQYPHHQYPIWVRDALHDIGIHLPYSQTQAQQQQRQQDDVADMAGENSNNTMMLHSELDRLDDDVEFKE